jgi:hypothetical protein
VLVRICISIKQSACQQDEQQFEKQLIMQCHWLQLLLSTVQTVVGSNL